MRWAFTGCTHLRYDIKSFVIETTQNYRYVLRARTVCVADDIDLEINLLINTYCW